MNSLTNIFGLYQCELQRTASPLIDSSQKLCGDSSSCYADRGCGPSLWMFGSEWRFIASDDWCRTFWIHERACTQSSSLIPGCLGFYSEQEKETPPSKPALWGRCLSGRPGCGPHLFKNVSQVYHFTISGLGCLVYKINLFWSSRRHFPSHRVSLSARGGTEQTRFLPRVPSAPHTAPRPWGTGSSSARRLTAIATAGSCAPLSVSHSFHWVLCLRFSWSSACIDTCFQI